ncbi:MAG: VanZ family protein [Phycisphaeraceae bacterium]|nr:VanZ family protein [Phycisphaeraceae bacterium]
MQLAMSWAVRNYRYLAAVLAVSGFAILYLAAKTFGADLEFAFLTDHQVRVICHFSGFGFLAVLVHAAIRRQVWLSWVIALSLAWGEEFHQLVVPGRYFTLFDLWVNFLGVTIFLILFHKLKLMGRLGRLLNAIKIRHTAAG